MFLIGFMLLSTPQEINKDKFFDDVNNAYTEYKVVTDYTSEAYSLQIVKGIIDNQATYGISFFSIRASDYYIHFEIDGVAYKTKPDSRGDYQVLAIKWRSYEQIKLKIYSKDGQPQSSTHSTVLEKFDKNTFIGDKAGLGNGGSLTTLKKVEPIIDFNVYIIISLVITGICFVIIIALAIVKRGMFSKERRKEGVFDFKNFLEANPTLHGNDDWIEVKPESEIEEKVIGDKPKEVYNKGYRYFDDDIISIDIQKHLQDAGFVVDYFLASDEEKNMIMLELMHLKNERKISNDVYLEEIYKLWKK